VGLQCCVFASQPAMHETFEAAFAGVQDVLEKRIDIDHGLLTALLSRGVLTQQHIATIEVCVQYIYVFSI